MVPLGLVDSDSVSTYFRLAQLLIGLAILCYTPMRVRRALALLRHFTFVTDCSALTWIFRSRNLSLQLHQGALRLMDYDMSMQRRPLG